jgi:hypothetical protein
MKTDIGPVFRELERDTERISAYLRLVIAAALAILLLTTDSPDPDNRLDIVLGGYAAISSSAAPPRYRPRRLRRGGRPRHRPGIPPLLPALVAVVFRDP